MDRVKVTGIASIALDGVADIVMHTSSGELFSSMLIMAGIEKDAAAV